MALQALLFLLVYAVALVYALIGQPIFGLYGYILNFFLDPPSRWWGIYLPGMRWSFIAAGVTLAAIVIHKRDANGPRPLRFGLFKLYLAYVAWMWIQTPWAADATEHARGLEYMSKYILVIFMITLLAANLRRIEDILLAQLAGGLYLGYLATTTYTGGRLDGIGGPGINDSSTLGLVMAAFSLVAGVLFHVGKGPRKWLPMLALPFLLNAIVAASSRGAFLALATGGIVLYLFRPPKETARLLLYGTLAAALFMSLASDFFLDRMRTIGGAGEASAETDKSTEGRLVLFEAQWQMFKDHPFGVGHQGTTALSYTYVPAEFHVAGGGRASHNTIMTVMVDQGIPGILLWSALLVGIYRTCRTNHGTLKRAGDRHAMWVNAALSAALATLFVGGQFSQQLKLEIFFWYMSLLMAMSHWIGRTYPEARRS